MVNILFICVHNAGRSQMAEAFVRQMAAEQGIEVQVESAGTIAGKELNPLALIAMEEIGVPMVGQKPKLVTDALVKSADKIISMGCGVDSEACPTRFVLSEDWMLDDPAGQSIEKVREIRDAIRERVAHLLDQIGGP